MREGPTREPKHLHREFCLILLSAPGGSPRGLPHSAQMLPILVQIFTSAHTCMPTSKTTCTSAFHPCPGAHPTLPSPTCLGLTCPDNFIPAHSCRSICTLLARVSLRPPGHLHNTPAQVHPHLPTFPRTCPGASAPHLLGCLQPASPAPPHLLLPAGQKSGQAEHPHLCRRRRSALPAPAAAPTFIGRALPAPRFTSGPAPTFSGTPTCWAPATSCPPHLTRTSLPQSGLLSSSHIFSAHIFTHSIPSLTSSSTYPQALAFVFCLQAASSPSDPDHHLSSRARRCPCLPTESPSASPMLPAPETLLHPCLLHSHSFLTCSRLESGLRRRRKAKGTRGLNTVEISASEPTFHRHRKGRS